jgi:hypothetical protein
MSAGARGPTGPVPPKPQPGSPTRQGPPPAAAKPIPPAGPKVQPRVAPPPAAPLTTTPHASAPQTPAAPAVAPNPAAAAPPQTPAPATAQPLIRALSTEPPPPAPPLIRALSTEPPPPAEPRAAFPSEEDTRVRVDEARRADEIRNEARALVHEALQELLAPIHHGMRELERRLDELERRPAAQPASARTAAARPMTVAQPASTMASAARVPADPFASAVATAPRAQVAPTSRASLLNIDVPFDGKRRQRKVTIFFSLLLLAVFGTLFATLALSYMR